MAKNISVLIFFLFFSSAVVAQLKLPKIFGDNMVLQRNVNIPVWGTATKESKVIVIFSGKEISIKADDLGKWKVLLPPIEPGGPYELIVKEELDKRIVSELHYKNIMIGDVWFASGQSNMEWHVNQSNNAKNEISKSDYPNIRFFKVPHAIESEPQSDIKSGIWKKTDSNTVGEFSAVAYFFARQIHQDQKVPIGVIESTWGGTPVEAWTSKEMLLTIPESKKIVLDKIANISQEEFDKSIEYEKSFWNIVMNSMNGLDAGYSQLSFDDSKWKSIEMPKVFRDIDSIRYEGIVWLRKYIDLPKSMVGKTAMINLGHPEMMYNIYVNDQLVCENKWNAEKKHLYEIPAGYLKEGRNIIGVRLAVLWGGGGFNPPADSLYISDGKNRISIAGTWKYIKDTEPSIPKIISYQKYPTYLFNGMVNPIIPFGIKGCIWYQGEENAANPTPYKTMFPLMIGDWRSRWKQGDFPFIYVQLANYMKRQPQPSESNWALLREAQAKTLAYPNTAMVTTIDVGEGDDIHPKNKQDVGYRLALAANQLVYKKNIISSGPVFVDMSINQNVIRIHFKHIGKGLITKENAKLKGFAVAGSDKKFYWAEAKIDGEYVIVKSDKVSVPVAVRYAWADNPDCNLYNKEGLPASPFRTDTW